MDWWGTDELLERLDFRDPEPEVVDLSPEGGVVETLRECKIECLMNEKVRWIVRFAFILFICAFGSLFG